VRTPSLVISKTVEGYPYEEFIYCGCGCQITIARNYKNTSKLRRYIYGHQNRKRKHTEKSLKNMSEGHKGQRGSMLGKFGKEHNCYGRKHSEETKRRMSEANKGNYKKEGVNITYSALHYRIKNRFPKSEHLICMLCNICPSQQLACITGIYNEELRNWAWLCTKCHKEWDNIAIRTSITLKRRNREIIS